MGGPQTTFGFGEFEKIGWKPEVADVTRPNGAETQRRGKARLWKLKAAGTKRCEWQPLK